MPVDIARTGRLDAQEIAHLSEALKPMYDQMIAAGKPRKVALVACMSKQLIILNTIVKNGTYWDETMV